MLHLPLHRFLALRLAAGVLGRIAGKGLESDQGLCVLHIGAEGRALAPLAKGHRVESVPTWSAADGDTFAPPLALPFGDHSFDAVLAIDTLHHLAPAERQQLLDEALRVTRSHVLIVGPFAGKVVDIAERGLEQLGGELGWGPTAPRPTALPRRVDVERTLRRRGCSTQAVGLGPAQRMGELARLVADLQEVDLGLVPLAEALCEGLVAEVGRAPFQRQAILAAVAGTQSVDLSGWNRAPGRSPRAPKVAELEHRALVALAEARGAKLRDAKRRLGTLETDLGQQGDALCGAQGAIEELGLAVLEARRQVVEAEARAHLEEARLLERTRALEAERGELRGDLARLRADRDGLERVAGELTAALECLTKGLDGALGPEPWPMPQFGDGPLVAQLTEDRDAALERVEQLERDVESLLSALAQAAGKEPTLVRLEDGDPWDESWEGQPH